MKNLTKFGIVSGFLLIGAFFLFSDSAQATLANSETASAVESSSPRSLYGQNCASCHGSNGKSQTAKGKRLEADDISGGISASKTIRVVTSGKGKMPAFGKRLSAAQIVQIAEYVHGL